MHGDALESEWSGICCHRKRLLLRVRQSALRGREVTRQMCSAPRCEGFAALGKTGGTLDYVDRMVDKGRESMSRTSKARASDLLRPIRSVRVSRSAQLWPILFDRCKLEIAFAHRTFAWGSDVRGKAHVHVVIIGLDRRNENMRADKRLFSYPDLNGDPEESRHGALSPYLFDSGGLSDPHLVVREESAPINGMGRLIIGSKPIDGGKYIFDAAERDVFLNAEPEAAPWLRPFIGAREYLRGGERWILALHDTPPDVLARLPRVRERISAVRAYREESESAPTRKLATTPTLYHVNVIPAAPFLVIPESSSERREYAPIGWLEPPTIPSNLVRILSNAALADFALLTSAMHMAWLRHIGGRLKSDYRYSIGIVYNTFPMPPTDSDMSRLDALAQAVLDARATHSGATLADLYDPDLMPPNLRRAHQALDRVVDRLYRRVGFASERERVEHLFMLYEKMRTPLEVGMKKRKKTSVNWGIEKDLGEMKISSRGI